MIRKKGLSLKLKRALVGCFFVILGLFGSLSVATLNSEPVYADPVEATSEVVGDSCKDSLGSIGWLVCPTTGKISEAVDWLYEKIENILVIKPIAAEDGSPIYEIWKYLKGFTNIVFIIFLLVVIYSQITGVGINNYGIKKALPKLIIAAILVNLSFIICQLAVDVSNIVGDGLRGMFSAVAESAIPAASGGGMSRVAYAEMYSSLAGGAALAIGGGVIAFETGAIWMLIPVVLGALVAVVSGLITIALRQAVVALLIMIAPLAMVAYILPNTEQWFKKWKDLLYRMLVFYPMFSLLFGASQLAGFAIIASASDGFGVLLGTAVQIFPLFFSWSLMKMSGTFLSGIHAKLNSLAAGPLATNRAWAQSHRQLSKQKHLASGRPTTPSLRLMQFLSNRQIAREEEIAEKTKVVKERGLAYRASQNYKRGDLDGKLSRKGEEAYEDQARVTGYQRTTLRDKNNFNKGFGTRYRAGTAARARVDALDARNMNAADYLKFETARGAKIDFDNATGFQRRVTEAMNAHLDQEAIDAGRTNYRLHGVLEDSENIARYNAMKQIMEGKDMDVHFAAADAANNFNAQANVMRNKFQTYFDLTAPTQDVVNRLSELTMGAETSKYIDPIIAGLRTLNMRGDTDLVREQLKQALGDYTNIQGGKIELGTYASQALANFLMFDVKDNDPFLRRFGKYINLETARMFNEEIAAEDKRTRRDISLYEYVNGEYADLDENGNIRIGPDGFPIMKKSKRDMGVVLKGTSFKGMERTAIKDMTDAIRDESYYIDANGQKIFSYEKFKENEEKLWNAIMANVIGDQFSFLSQSEQIVALGKGLTGVDVQKHQIDWEGIFGKENARGLTAEQKADYLEFLNKRTKIFLGGHVPVQIARTKTDMLEAIKTQYALRDAIKEKVEYDENGEVVRVNDPDILNLGFKDNKAGYDEFEKERLEGVKKEFVKSFKPDALQGFGKMYRKGYQGEAKDGLIQLLKEELDKQPSMEERDRRRRTRVDEDDDDEDGMPVGDEFGASSYEGRYSGAKLRIEEIKKGYSGMAGNLKGKDFWGEAKSILGDADIMGEDLGLRLREFEENELPDLDRATVDVVWERIQKRLLGEE